MNQNFTDPTTDFSRYAAGDVVDATTASSSPRAVRVYLSCSPWLNQHGGLVLCGDGGPVVVDPATTRLVSDTQ